MVQHEGAVAVIELAIGAALAGGAAWLGRAKQSLDAAITMGMSNEAFAKEAADRGWVLLDASQEAWTGFPTDHENRAAYQRGLDALREARVAMRDPRIRMMSKACYPTGKGFRWRPKNLDTGKRGSQQSAWRPVLTKTGPSYCEDLDDAWTALRQGIEQLGFAREDRAKGGLILPAIPLSGAL